MSKIISPFNNLARGSIDHDLNGRFDLPIYTTGADSIKNFVTDFKGSARFRTGFEKMYKHKDCAMIEFKFNSAQTYIVVIDASKIRFLSYDVTGNFGWVVDGSSNIIELTSPWTLAQAKVVAKRGYAQNGDVMTLCHNDVVIQEITRVSATSFTIGAATLTDTPFDNPSSGTVGQPCCATYHRGRIYYGGPGKKKTNVYGSKAGDYHVMTVGTADDDGLAFTIDELTEGVLWLKSGQNSLIAGSSQGNVSINGGSTSSPITPTTVEASLTNTDGTEGSYPVQKDNLLFYIDSTGRRVKYFSYDLLTESFIAEDSNFVSYDITRGKLSKLVYIKDRNDLVFFIRGDNVLVSLNFNLKEKIVGWHEHPSAGLVQDIVHMTDNDGNPELFALIKYGSDYMIERLAKEVEFAKRVDFWSADDAEAEDDEAYWKYISEQLKDCIYLDSCETFSDLNTSTITYDPNAGTITSSANDFSSGDVGKRIVYKTATGREWGMFEITGYSTAKIVTVDELTGDGPTSNTSSSWYLTAQALTGLTDKASKEVSVVADGGYLGEFTVSAGGALDIGQQASVIRIGFAYTGLLKTFNLGFAVQGINTQITMKNLVRAGLRFVSSAGGEVGTSMYKMEKVQDYDPSGYYDLPPLPMEGTKFVDFDDDTAVEKVLYVRQSEPLPFCMTAIFPEVDYGRKT
jgi:hypothetical protein